ncbi:MAG: hypothetical protein HN348_29995, partial [Proteobacteria bacterium]|nr:hypothetical protein [Pseudomonadota bacterium]
HRFPVLKSRPTEPVGPGDSSGFAGDELDHQILLTIFHEYIHYFESFLEQRHQPLKGREEGFFVSQYTLQQARWKDHLYVGRRIGFWGLVAAVAAGFVGIAVSESWDGPPQLPEPIAVQEAMIDEGAPEKTNVLNEGQLPDDQLMESVQLAVLLGKGPRDIEAAVGQPSVGNTARFRGIFTWGVVEVDPDEPNQEGLSLNGAKDTVCWKRRSESVLDDRVLCAAWFDNEVRIAFAVVKATGR